MVSAANLKTPSPTDFAGWTLARTNLTVKDQDNEILTNQTTVTRRFRHRRAEAHRGRRPRTDQRKADATSATAPPAPCPTTSCTRPNSNLPVAV